MRRHRRLRTLPAVLVAVALAGPLAGCGIPSTGAIEFGESPRLASNGRQLYFVLDGALFPTLRTDDGVTRKRAAIAGADLLAADLLAIGPEPEERAAGLTTEIPAGLRVVAANRATGDDRQIILHLTSRITEPDVTRLSALATAQLTCTAVAASVLLSRPVERVSLRDDADRRRGPLTCPIPVPGGGAAARDAQ